MKLFDSIKSMLRGNATLQASGGGKNDFGDDTRSAYWVHVKCQRCGEPLRARVNLLNDPSRDEDGETWIVRKSLSGSGQNRCFQTVAVTLRFNAQKTAVLQSDVAQGELITAKEYQRLRQAATDASEAGDA